MGFPSLPKKPEIRAKTLFFGISGRLCRRASNLLPKSWLRVYLYYWGTLCATMRSIRTPL